MKKYVTSLILAAFISPVVLFGNSIYQVNSFDDAWEDKPSSECLIILGSRSLPGGIPGLMMRERLAMAQKVINDDVQSIILTGGSLDEEKTEAEVMKEQLLIAGIEEDRLFLESKSTSTLENLTFSKSILAQQECKSVDILSHDFHLARAKMTARHLDIPVGRMIPAEKATANTKARLSREYLAYSWYWLSFFLD
jgi:uncharacterized SAM-binding protein YcdF (DUF218 family)